jgi:hypothetical protein
MRLTPVYASAFIAMSAGKRQQQYKGLSYLEGEDERNSKHIRAPERDTCYSISEAVSLVFDPNRVLLSRVFFNREYEVKYVSIGYYPTKAYWPLV